MLNIAMCFTWPDSDGEKLPEEGVKLNQVRERKIKQLVILNMMFLVFIPLRPLFFPQDFSSDDEDKKKKKKDKKKKDKKKKDKKKKNKKKKVH